jgi:hypothetical protein
VFKSQKISCYARNAKTVFREKRAGAVRACVPTVAAALVVCAQPPFHSCNRVTSPRDLAPRLWSPAARTSAKVGSTARGNRTKFSKL